MARRKRKQLIACLLLLLTTAIFPTSSLADDAGLIASIEGSHKFSKKLSASMEIEFRSRNNFRTADRVSLGAEVGYKLLPWLKASASYNLLIDNNREDISYQDDGVSYNNWRPSYWGLRHRFNVSLTGSYKVQRVEVSLRERWQYTYRRSRTEWDIPKCKFDPFASVEFHTTRELEKTRFIIGVDHSVKKTHVFQLYYRYQLTGSKSDEPNIHMLGLGYTYKF